MTSVEESLALLERGAVTVIDREELRARLAEGKPLRVKAGFDPTRPDLHLGHVVLMNKLRQFQMLGHQVVFIVGDFTAQVGDPTGRNKSRPPLTRDEVLAGARTYAEQALKVLDAASTEIRYNSEWLEKLTPQEFVRLAARRTVARTMERRDFRERFDEGKDIYLHEFLYPLLQAYDSVAIDADIELGGTDQLFNLTVGRDLMTAYGKRAQMVLTVPLLEGLDAKLVDGEVVGPKMSKSSDNYVGVSEPAFDQFRKLMLVNDGVIWRYYELLSALSTSEIAAIRTTAEAEGAPPRWAQRLFAREIVARFHDAAAAVEAEQRYEAQRASASFAADAAEVTVEGDLARGGVWIAKALELAKLATGSSEGRRLVQNKAVLVNNVRVTDERAVLPNGGTYEVVVTGKNKRFAKITVSSV
ncbi:MAG: tyrosine--tRNA ligase [Deltaproteobacteria bacterium]|nr:tyrosine--tRNA ligase [Deltaproteobacteria bacterium]